MSTSPQSIDRPGTADEPEEPDALLCPVTRVMFRDPVVCESGHTYERAALEQFWASAPQPRDPVTNVVVSAAILLPNWDKRRCVAAWLDVCHATRPQYAAKRSSRAITPMPCMRPQ